MGITGLSSFVREYSDICLKPYELKDTRVIVDGSNFVYWFHREHIKSYDAFGGDYDLFYYGLKHFFANIRKCNVTPIVIFDGGHERRKQKTLCKRLEANLVLLRNFSRSFWTGKFPPLSIKRVAYDVLEELDITFTTCFFDADAEIAALATYFNCPVLSNDSDFFIYNVLCIPLYSLVVDLKRVSGTGTDASFYMKCLKFDTSYLVKHFQGLDCSLLPLIPVLIGNDYHSNSIFHEFFNHIKHVKSTKFNNQAKIASILKWLQNEDFESAKNFILSRVHKNYANAALKIIDDVFQDYRIYSPSVLSFLNIENESLSGEKLKSDNNDKVKLEDEKLILQLPDQFIKSFQRGKIVNGFMDMMHLNRYYLPLQVEDIRQPSSHAIAFPILSVIYKILCSMIEKSDALELNLYVTQLNKQTFVKEKLAQYLDHCFVGLNVKNLVNEPQSVKCDFMYKILGMDESVINTSQVFDNDWILIFISLIYWAKNLKVKLTKSHFHSLIIMVIANFVQVVVGYYKNFSTFMKCKAGALGRLTKVNGLAQEKSETIDLNGKKISSLLKAIPEYEYLLFTYNFIKLRQTENSVISNGYFISTIHAFASFQSCLFYILQINALLNFPFPELKLGQFYCGTLLYNLYYLMNQKSINIDRIENKLNMTPNIMNIYNFMINCLKGYISEDHQLEKPIVIQSKKGCRKKKHKRHRRKR